MANWMAIGQRTLYFAVLRTLPTLFWNHFVGKGITNDVDEDVRQQPAVNAEFAGSLYLEKDSSITTMDFKQIVRDICNVVRTYHRATRDERNQQRDDRQLFHTRTLRRIRSEILLDSITQATDTKNKFCGIAAEVLVDRPDSNGNTSSLFSHHRLAERLAECLFLARVRSKPEFVHRLSICSTVETIARKSPNGQTCDRTTVGGGGRSPRDTIEELYVRWLTRMPTEMKPRSWGKRLPLRPTLKLTLEDTYLGADESREVCVNHDDGMQTHHATTIHNIR